MLTESVLRAEGVRSPADTGKLAALGSPDDGPAEA